MNPPYNQARGAATLISTPPFDFDHVVLRVFPLRASIYRLRQFCDRYLNMDQPFHRFEPSLPYVFLSIINYGRMAQQASNLGWVSQNEVAFGVPMNWFVRPEDWQGPDDDRWEFHDSASASPYIFVDEVSSLMTGREVFGWAKSLAWLTPDVDAWARNPLGERVLFRLGTMVFAELFAGRRQEARTLLEIEQEPPVTVSQAPPDLFSPFNPLLALPRAALESMRMTSETLELLAGLPIRGYSPDRQLSGLMSSAGGGDLFGQVPAANTINLKQFRDSERPDLACYQALIHAPMTINCFNTGALLGDPAVFRGDPSGGYRVKLHAYDAWPIVDSLGLEVESESGRRDHSVATLRPVCPFWVDVDFQYGRGRAICWRTGHTEWTRPPDEPRPLTRPRYFSFNTAEGGALDQVAGPFEFPNVTKRVLPLLADHDRLQLFVDEYLNHRPPAGGSWQPGMIYQQPAGRPAGVEGADPDEGLPGSHFEVWGNHVYLVASSFEEVASDTASVGWWARQQLAFFIPVKWYRWNQGAGGWELASLALVSPYMFADSEVAATTGREVQGWPVVQAELESPRSNWMEACGPSLEPSLLSVRTKVFPALNAGSRMVERTLLEITGADVLPYNAPEEWRAVAHDWGDKLVSELRGQERRLQGLADRRHYPGLRAASDLDGEVPSLEHLKALALEVLANQRPCNIVALKQFLDAGEPDRACYQSVTLYTEEIQWLHDLREIDERLHVAIHRYPNFPIVQKLGLKVKWTDRSGASVVDYLQPQRPCWMRLTMRANLGCELYRRAGTTEWQAAGVAGYFTGETETAVGADLVDRIDHPRQQLAQVDVRRRLEPLAGSKEVRRELMQVAREVEGQLRDLQEGVLEHSDKQRLKEAAHQWAMDRQLRQTLLGEVQYWGKLREDVEQTLRDSKMTAVNELADLLAQLIDGIELGPEPSRDGEQDAEYSETRQLALEMKNEIEQVVSKDDEFLDRELEMLTARLKTKHEEVQRKLGELREFQIQLEHNLEGLVSELLEIAVTDDAELAGIDRAHLEAGRERIREEKARAENVAAEIESTEGLEEFLGNVRKELRRFSQEGQKLRDAIEVAKRRIGDLGREGHKFPKKIPLTSGLAEAAVEELTPQLALQSILSHEWAHAGTSRWLRRSEELRTAGEAHTRLKPDFILRRDTLAHRAVQSHFEKRHGLFVLDEIYWALQNPGGEGRGGGAAPSTDG